MKLKNKHIQMIAIGGAIGTGLFFGTAKSLQLTGPSIILAYLIGGFVMYVIMRALGEMTVYAPNSGAFSHYAYTYVGDYLGFISGWYAWFEYVFVCMLEVSAVTIFLDYWIPGIPHWKVISALLLIFFIINMTQVRLFGEFEFWFAGIKVSTIIIMIVFAFYLVSADFNIRFNTIANINNSVSNHLFAHGLKGFLFSMVLVIFSFGGVQFIGIAAADAENPTHSVPKAVNGVIIRIILFYIGTLIVIVALYPFNKLDANVSPFVDVFDKIGIHSAAQVMNVVAITAALSAFNSCLYAAARMLANLANHASAPKFLGDLNQYQVPRKAVIFSTIIIAITILINYLFPERAIYYLIAVATTSIIVTWTSILVCHLAFRKKISEEQLSYKLPLSPYSNYLALAVLFSVVVIMTQMKDMRFAVYMMPVWLIGLTIGCKLTQKKQQIINDVKIIN